MKKQLDPLTQTIILLALVVLFSVIALKKGIKTPWAYAPIGLTVLFLARIITLRNSPALILENDYTGNGCYKCESETECIIRPLAQLDAQTAVDGINTGARPGAVFKLSNGIHARITASGDVRPYSMVSRWFAGWRDRAYFEKKGVLAQWQPLFDC